MGRMRKDGRRGAREGGFVQRRLSSCNINELKRMQTGRVWERLRRQVIQLGFLWTLEVSPFSLKCVDFSVLPPPSSFLPPLPGWRWHHWAQGNLIKAPRPHQSRPFLHCRFANGRYGGRKLVNQVSCAPRTVRFVSWFESAIVSCRVRHSEPLEPCPPQSLASGDRPGAVSPIRCSLEQGECQRLTSFSDHSFCYLRPLRASPRLVVSAASRARTTCCSGPRRGTQAGSLDDDWHRNEAGTSPSLVTSTYRVPRWNLKPTARSVDPMSELDAGSSPG